ncbi:nuclear transport factor 2 family protein [Arenicella sp. 4NH20-0111]|uniref:hypothetical protein n=1 Tax=Arenicella sp. 4NH20-0111 TaxID=3127648 RepID=UPI00310B3A6B
MPNYPDSFDRMLDAWNEQDPTRIRAHLEAALTSDVYFADPTIVLTGIDDFEKMVHEVQGRIPGAVYSRTSRVDTHHDLYRYHWAIHVNGEQIVQGFDVVEERKGKVARVLGFFGDLPINAT